MIAVLLMAVGAIATVAAATLTWGWTAGLFTGGLLVLAAGVDLGRPGDGS